MKKIIFVLFFISSFSYAQEKVKMYVQKVETITFEQYDLIKKINEYYPDILVSKEVKNNSVTDFNNSIYLDPEFVYILPSDCKFYSVKLIDSTTLQYVYILKDDTYISGTIRHFNGDYIRTLFKAKGDIRLIQFYINGKLLNEKKN